MAFVYSCCFWFSLRLGGILIGLFSLVKALIVLVACGMAHANPEKVKEEIIMWTNDLILIYTKGYMDNLTANLERYTAYCISVTCLYIITCLSFIYGAYTCHNILMIAYLVVELVRLVILSMLVVTGLLVLKKNTMDIGLLIGASVASGFLLLGLFYLWVCAVNLPILINEMERDEQAATIARLRQALEANKSKTFHRGLDDIPLARNMQTSREPIFTVAQKKRSDGSRIPIYYSNFHQQY
ncbi:uncharacterized protein [Choristoneura fumiferana]|uniref:uncharacterized protein n=1 Tax=Choristoneura fumiferana TaxID=7141 RepID=UPI003D15C7CD